MIDDGLPKHTKEAQNGETGVRIVEGIIEEEFGWIFRRIPQEQDRGIDALIEVVNPNRSATGQLLAFQIKCGSSFFVRKSRFGYVYRGERKHFNYYSNFGAPVILVICHPKSKDCYWVRFEAEHTEGSGTGDWNIVIPFDNKLRESKSDLESITPPLRDDLSAAEHSWFLNKVLLNTDFLALTATRDEVEHTNTTRIRLFFDRLTKNRELAFRYQGNISIYINGYNNDSREIFEIEDVRRYVAALLDEIPELFFFLKTDSPSNNLRSLALCLVPVSFVGGPNLETRTRKVKFDPTAMAQMFERQKAGLERMFTRLSLSAEESDKIVLSIAKSLGIEIVIERQ